MTPPTPCVIEHLEFMQIFLSLLYSLSATRGRNQWMAEGCCSGSTRRLRDLKLGEKYCHLQYVLLIRSTYKQDELTSELLSIINGLD